MDKLTLLRRVVANIHVEPLRAGLTSQDEFDRSPFAKARLGPQGTIGVLKAGGEALSDLAEEIFQAASFYERGSTFEEVSDTLFDVLIQEFLQRKGDPVTAADLILVEGTVVKRSNSVTGLEIVISREIMNFRGWPPLRLTHLLPCSGEQICHLQAEESKSVTCCRTRPIAIILEK